MEAVREPAPDEKRQMHIDLWKDEIGKYVLMPGAPERVELIARKLKDPRPLRISREFASWIGELAGEKITVISTGIGCPSTAICMEEMIHLGAHTFIRIGTGGSYQKRVKVNDLVISTGAIRDEGTTPPLVPREFPAVADLRLQIHARSVWLHQRNELCIPEETELHFGITQTVDNLYAEFTGYSARGPEMRSGKEMWIRANVLGVSMQAAAMYVIAALRNVRAMEILAITDLAYADEEIIEAKGKTGVNSAIELGIATMQLAIESIRQ